MLFDMSHAILKLPFQFAFLGLFAFFQKNQNGFKKKPPVEDFNFMISELTMNRIISSKCQKFSNFFFHNLVSL